MYTFKGKNPILSHNKFFILEKRTDCKTSSIVVNEIMLPQGGGRFNYMVPSGKIDLESLYALAAIINSSVMQFYYKYRMQRNKNIPVKDFNQIPLQKRGELVRLST